MNGYIKLHRKLLENPLMKKPAWAWLWVVLLLMANHKDEEFIFNGEVVKLKSGQFLTGRKQLSIKSGLPESTIEDILRFLESRQQIRQQKTSKHRIITIVKWGEYQSREKDFKKSDNNPTTIRQQADTYKNDKNDKNILANENSQGEFNSQDYIKKMLEDKNKHIQLIAKYFISKGLVFPSKIPIQSHIRRWVKDARVIVEYPQEQVNKTFAYVLKEFPDVWNLSTIRKFISKQ